ncbi:MAG TPA: hypothetical protein VKE74_23035, partial [Gemmataceae bacterium]|nr:hypothetical protein [Gemmataceae bacterium]
GSSEQVDAAVVQGTEGTPTRGRLSARHTYARAGVYTATVTVTDDDGGAASARFTYGAARIDVVSTINLKSQGVIPVKVFSDPGFDARQIDVRTLRFGPGGAPEAHGTLHGEGAHDVMTHYDTQASAIRPTDTVAFLSGQLIDGTPFVGMDSIRIVPGGGGEPPTSPAGGTKFFVVDPAADRAFRYGPDGAATGSFALDGAAANARGAASNAAGDRVWVIDGTTHAVTVQGADGRLLGSWRAEGLVRPEDLATDGTDVWVVDAGQRRVFRYLGGAEHTAGVALPASSFGLHADNGSPTGLATVGGVLWVTDDAADAVFVYDTAGELLGRWGLDPANANPSGVTGDPTGVSPDLWVLDRDDRAVYRYAAGTIHRAGGQTAAGTFALGRDNTRPEGIADPPGGGSFTIGSVVSDSIGAAGEVDVWTFQAAAGQRLFFDSQGGTVASSLQWTLTDPNGTQLFSGIFVDHDVIVLTTGGEYSLTLSSILNRTGTYQFQVFDVPAPDVTPIHIDEVVSGTIAVPGAEHDYTFTGAVGQRLFFDVQQNTGSPVRLGFTLLRPDGSVLFPESSQDRDVFTLTVAGTYTVVVSGFTTQGTTGSYQFRLWEVPLPTTTPFQVGDVVSGTIDIPGEEDFYTFAGTAGQRLYFDIQQGGGTSSGIGFRLLRPDGSALFPTTFIDIGTF